MKKLPISIIILTDRNDNIFLEALASAQFAAEVLIVDNNSNNDWKKLKDTYSFTVITTIHELTNFSTIRNETASYARYDWIFFLDSDEIIPTDGDITLAKCLATSGIEGWFVKRKDYFLGKPLNHGEAAAINLLRLYQKNKGHFTGAVHEICVVKGKTKASGLTLIHKSHTSISSFLTTITIYALQISKNKRYKNKINYLNEMIFFPPAKFIQNFLFRQGFRDGIRGFIYALMMSLHSFFVRVYSYENTK